jgi:seryl-tRNA synthetase
VRIEISQPVIMMCCSSATRCPLIALNDAANLGALKLRARSLQISKVFVRMMVVVSLVVTLAILLLLPTRWQELSALQEKRNQIAFEQARILNSGGGGNSSGSSSVHEQGRSLKAQIAVLEEEAAAAAVAAAAAAEVIPNMTHAATPLSEPSLLRYIGRKREFGFEPRDHEELLRIHKGANFEAAAAAVGARFTYLMNNIALMEMALINWALVLCAADGFTPVLTPDVVQSEVMKSCGFQPRGPASQVYSIADESLCLIATSEITLAALYKGTTVDVSKTPVNMVGFSHCFRREVGGAGAQNRGLFRLHQFSKVELFTICGPDSKDDQAAFDKIIALQTRIVEALQLHAHVLQMPANDLGASATRKIDIEAWMPGRKCFGEISSASSCGDYQTRRLNIRCKSAASPGSGSKPFAYTLNGTALAVPRIILAILETHQQQDGSIRIPPPLQPFMGGKDVILPLQ